MPRKSKVSSTGGRSPRADKAIEVMPPVDEFNPSATGLTSSADSANTIVPVADGPISSIKGHVDNASKAIRNLPPVDESNPSATGLNFSVDMAKSSVPVADGVFDLIIDLHRQRCFAMEQRKRSDLALGAFLRTMLGWRKDLPEAERKAIATRAAALVKDPTGSEWQTVIAASVAARGPFETVEKAALKEMEAISKSLPVWADFGEPIRGFGAASLAVIVAEAGDLSGYSNHSKLWKRMGLAVMGDVRQGGLAKGSSAEDWIAHGYNKQRRSRMWNIGDTLLKAQVRKVKDAAGEDTGERTSLGKYGAAYLARKAYELAREPDMQPIKAHRRAQRYAEKRLLRDLWQAWRRAIVQMPETAKEGLPVAEFMEAAE